jgi:hypothetical protein
MSCAKICRSNFEELKTVFAGINKNIASAQALPPATVLYPKATCLHQALIKCHTISGAMCFAGTKLVMTCVKKALGVDLYALCRLLI